MNQNSIDIVIPWVDGDDPVLKRRRFSYMNDGMEAKYEDVAGESRYKDCGELKYCIASINKFAPFVRKIFIVTDNQTPVLEPHVSNLFPGRQIPIEIVDHKEIFKGYEEYLPIFNSRGIETVIWRIPDLSEKFILMNDDFFITREVTPEDFFIGDKTVCYAGWILTFFGRFLRKIKGLKKGHKAIGFKDSMINAVDRIGGHPWFLCLGHTPRALRKSFYENFYKNNENILIDNISSKFRDPKQFNSQELFYISEHKRGKCIRRPLSGNALYLKPKSKPDYIARKIKEFRSSTSAPFCCVNSLSSASAEDQKRVYQWMEEVLG